MHIHGKRMADYTGFVAPRLPKRGVLHPSKRGSEHIYPRQNDVVNAHDIRYFRPSSSLFAPSYDFHVRASLSLSLGFHPPYFVIVRVPTDGIWSTCEPLERSSWRDQRAFSSLPGWNRFYGDVTVSRDSREIWQRANRAISRIKVVRNDLEEGGFIIPQLFRFSIIFNSRRDHRPVLRRSCSRTVATPSVELVTKSSWQ